jgi:hypothetical protein
MPVDEGPADHRALTIELHERLDTLYLAAQVLSHQAYTLSAPRVTRVHPDGRRDPVIFTNTGHISTQLEGAGVACADATADARKHRIARRNFLAELAAAYITDPIVSSILRSYSAAVADSRNEFLHLYEIREAISENLQADGATKEWIIGGVRWRRLRRLANQEPVLQGRHRGQHLQSLRDATPEELAEARDIGRQMIEDYLQHLKAVQPP